jgi:phage shock protein PspC (stress-responsive transcriptional regulator)
MRSRDHHVLGGVAGGIAERMDTDAGLVRALFIVLTLFTAGIGILVYIVLWISLPLEPPAGTTVGDPEDAGRHQRRPHPASGRVGTLVVGLLLVLAGVAWLLEATDSIDVDWAVVLAIALIGLGALLVLTLGSMARGLLVSLGILLTIALAFVSLVDINFESSFGDRTEEPATVADLQSEYSHAFGSMTLDLRSLELPQGTTEVKASTSFGSLKVILPADVPVRIDARTTFGNVNALNSEANGLRADRIVRDDSYDTANQRIKLKVTATFGSVEVER